MPSKSYYIHTECHFDLQVHKYPWNLGEFQIRKNPLMTIEEHPAFFRMVHGVFFVRGREIYIHRIEIDIGLKL